MKENNIITFEKAKQALVAYFAEENIEDFGFTQSEFDRYIHDFQSPIYDEAFLRETALCFDELIRNECGYQAG